MATARAIGWFLSLALLSSCAAIRFDQQGDISAIPRDIRAGAADMVIERVEPTVGQDEVRAAVQRLVAQAPICLSWPGVWLDASEWRSFFIARYDLMARDWGSDVAQSSRERMQEFVELGFLVARPRPNRGSDVIEYELTPIGARFLRGSPYGGERPSFCGPSQRRVVDITELEFGEFECGTLRVRFTHSADEWPSWLSTPAARQRFGVGWLLPGQIGHGSVSLSRQWFRPRDLPPEVMTNGALTSACMDASRQRVTGDDLNLSSP